MSIRLDSGSYITHLIRKTNTDNPLDILKRILSEGQINGSSKYIRGGSKVICFTETNFPQLANFIALENILAKKEFREKLVNVKSGVWPH